MRIKTTYNDDDITFVNGVMALTAFGMFVIIMIAQILGVI